MTPEEVHGKSGGEPLQCYTGRVFPPVKRRPESPEGDDSDRDELFEVRIIDNDYNTYGDVMGITMTALGVTEEQAFAIAWEVDHRGSCCVAYAGREEAESIAEIIRTIGIEVRVNPISDCGDRTH